MGGGGGHDGGGFGGLCGDYMAHEWQRRGYGYGFMNDRFPRGVKVAVGV